MADGASSSGLAARVPAWVRRIPVDVAAFVVIALVVVISRKPYIRHGIVFNDASWYFHFGHRTLEGDVPYRDYVFQVGPLPIYIDALFQKLFGAKYIASMYASLLVHVLRVFVIWALVRRLAGWKAAGLFCVWCAFDLHFGWAHHWSWQYAQLFVVGSGLFFVLAAHATTERRILVHLALAGLSAGLVVSTRQATVVTIGAILFVATTILLVRKDWFTRQRFVALWAGFAAAFVMTFGLLACAGALGPSIQQIFLDAPQKKSIHGITAILDALSGGSLVLYQVPWWAGFLRYLALPLVLVAATVCLVARGLRTISTRTLAAAWMPAALLVGLATRYADLFYFADVPRCLFSVTTAIAAVFPDRMRRWFGVEPIVAIGLGALPLASDWALEMSYPGRGWGDWPALLTGVIFLALASSHLSLQVKTWLCAAFGAIGLLHVTLYLRADLNPFAKNEASDGTLTETSFKWRSPVMRGLLISESRRKTLDWLAGYVKPGNTCFIYGTIPIVYDLLECKNPTRIDTTIPDFITARDARAAIATLTANPPDFVIAQESSFMNPPLSHDFEGKIEFYSELNSDASKVMYLGLRHMLLDRYEDLGLVSDAIGPALAKQASYRWDTHQAIRLYRRRR